MACKTPDPRREYQRGRILAAIASEAMTAQQLADRLHLTRDGINLILAGMRAEKPRLVHVAGHAPNPSGGRPAPMYRPGDKKDARYVKTRAAKGRVTLEQQYSRILKLLATEPMTAAAIVEKMELQRARLYVTTLHDQRKVHIHSWNPHPIGGYPSPVYAVGEGEDAPRPAPLSTYEKNARHWAKLKADPQRHALHLHMQRVRRKPQTWFSALIQPKRGDNRLPSDRP
jgi:hypothetical protein